MVIMPVAWMGLAGGFSRLCESVILYAVTKQQP